MELVTVAIFNTSFDAHLVQGRLSADGVESYIKDEHTIQTNPFYNVALGGIKLQVVNADVEKTVWLLRTMGYRTAFDMIPAVTKKQSHILIRFIKYLVAVIAVLGFLYYKTFGDKLPFR